MRSVWIAGARTEPEQAIREVRIRNREPRTIGERVCVTQSCIAILAIAEHNFSRSRPFLQRDTSLWG